MNKLGKKGVTLAELVVVLAMLAIVSTMVTSFCILINNYHALNRKRAAITERLSGVERTVSNFLFDCEENNRTIAVNANMVTVTSAGETYTLTVSDQTLIAVSPQGETRLNVKELQSVTFQLKAGTNGKALLLCKATYLPPQVKVNPTPQAVTYAFYPKQIKTP
ncbi:MAG: prepilin-type N-terminal cleavage/methylation domain-containing protein [Clostridiales bacterium]|nr:prepilin-type N-terminal cleavage/methylation domain-containing protein [Clostridiales bacterium]